ncbi:ankyrin repeat domain-containing protein 63 [Esox lucius]|uniref:Ankyrin repeat domain 63 n=1 Tax=Esox lucius TaxID=8010 RepID=A0AAY5KJB1_ESOLU|nr:ankyrin repeat domain-containing protein 63 [Esox lucius]
MMRPKDLRQGSGTKTFLDAMHDGKVHLARFVLDALDNRIINSKTENGRTPLMFAVCLRDPGGRVKFTRLLVEKGADVNCQDERGRTSLSLACELGHLDAVKLLVQFNADPDVSDAWGNSALMYAAYSGHSQVLEFLVRAFKKLGLKLDRTNQAGHSAIQVASYFGHDQCVQALNSGRRGVISDDIPGEVGIGKEAGMESHPPNKLPRQILERFSRQFHSQDEDHLPGVFQRQLRVGDGSGLWERIRSQNQSLDRNGNHLERARSEEEKDDIFTAKQRQNCKQRDTRGVKTLSHHPESSQKDVSRNRGMKQDVPESIPLRSKAKPLNLDLLSSRKQSYQGDVRDTSLSSSKLKRASLQDERSLIAKIEYQESTCEVTNDTVKSVLAPKALSKGKSKSPRAPEDSTRPPKNENNEVSQSSRGGSLKRGLLPPNGRLNKLLSHRTEMEPDKIPGFSGLGNRLMRRFTAPEFMRLVIDCTGSSHGRGRMSRSETFPFSHTHQRVNSQPSVDSISGVKCEFESSSLSVSLQ